MPGYQSIFTQWNNHLISLFTSLVPAQGRAV